MDGIRMAVDEELDSVVSFSEAECSAELLHHLPADMRLEGFEIKESNRQELKTSYRINGMLYICQCEKYLKTRSFYSTNGKAIIFNREYAIDIDNEYDFLLAEFMMERKGLPS